MNNLLLTIIVAAVFAALIENILPEGTVKKPALGILTLITIAIVFLPFADVFLKAKEKNLFKGGDVFIEKNQK